MMATLSPMKSILSFFLVISLSAAQSQELYIHTDPASNTPAHNLAFRLNGMLMPMADLEGMDVDRNSYRLSADLMYGISKNWMVKVSGYASDMFQPQLEAEAASFYTKYRFLSRDDFHKHFRMAAFGKIAYSSNPSGMETKTIHYLPDGNGGTSPHEIIMKHGADELNLEGNHSGWQAGVVATQLIQKLALSGTVSYLNRWEDADPEYILLPPNAQSALQYTFSAGYLLFPKDYKSYDQTNINLYAEFIGQSALDKSANFVDVAPSVQFIIKSKARVDLSYRFQIDGNMRRFNTDQWLLRFEYNWLQAFRNN